MSCKAAAAAGIGRMTTTDDSRWGWVAVWLIALACLGAVALLVAAVQLQRRGAADLLSNSPVSVHVSSFALEPRIAP